MDINKVIYILRNPYDFSFKDVREVRLQAASFLEEKVKRGSFYRPKEMHNFCYELSKDSLLTRVEFMALAKQLSRRGYSDGQIKNQLRETAITWKVEPLSKKAVEG